MKKIILFLMATVVVLLSMCTATVFAVEEGHELTRGVNSYSYATIDDLQKVTKGTRLYGYEEKIIEVERTYQVNAFFILAVANVETGMGNAGTGVSKNNCFGISGNSGYRYFDNVGQSVECFGELINRKYFGNGRYTIPRIAEWYCNSYWGTKVEKEINNLYYRMID